jgi:hypothetical protein
MRNSPNPQSPFLSFFPQRTHPKSGTSQKKKIYFFELIMPLLPVKQWQSHRRKELRSCFIGAIFQCPKPLWMLIFYNQCPSAFVLNLNIGTRALIIKNRADSLTLNQSKLFSSLEFFTLKKR